MALAGQRAVGSCTTSQRTCAEFLASNIVSRNRTSAFSNAPGQLAVLRAISPSVAADAAPSTSSLATYQFRSSSSDVLRPGKPQLKWSHMWFEAMVQMVVKQLDGTPFLLRVSTQGQLRLSYVSLSSEELAQGWDHIQQQHSLASGPDDALILVHPVPSVQQPCAVSVINHGVKCDGCPHNHSSSSHEQPELLHGKFGDCCQHDHSSSSSTSSRSGHPQPHSSSTTRSRSSDSVLAYYGLVVQTRNAADPLQGCYLLKTMQVKQQSGSVGGCHCTHYSLTRVCKGPSLQQQYQAAWLVSN